MKSYLNIDAQERVALQLKRNAYRWHICAGYLGHQWKYLRIVDHCAIYGRGRRHRTQWCCNQIQNSVLSYRRRYLNFKICLANL
jgi:hypothetical protein